MQPSKITSLHPFERYSSISDPPDPEQTSPASTQAAAPYLEEGSAFTGFVYAALFQSVIALLFIGLAKTWFH